jgi:dTDP-glucose pyrophosphorylase
MNTESISWYQAVLQESANIQDAIDSLNQFGFKIVLVVNKSNQLLGTVSDGDIRRGLLKGLDLYSPITTIVHKNALVAPPEMPRDIVMQLMVANKIQQIPVVDVNRCVVDLHLWDAITTPTVRDNLMVIMAGGLGTRLLPHTEECPKPMVLVSGKPMLEHIIDRAKLAGFSNFTISVRHLGHMIEEYFGNGDRFNVKISYLKEDSPLGTAGALSLLNPRPNSPFVVTNGDVLTDIQYGEVLDFHNRNNAKATMAVRVHEWQHPFGVVHTDGIEIIGFEEKPLARTHINAGIYVLSPNVLDDMGRGERCDMPTIFERLLAKSQRIVAYPMHEPWLDVGRPADLEIANNTNR